ncbi:hypothetical protein PoB_001560400 [Plakobranchus ocellatus]|uniref:Uncharacterized protein n=1 Tax=Plakobranchus ocellatus TaxID=259542 RepID=A0AAV3Z1B1_9GAST|nr:hypothetical protein PoB_001560400 [Plakobranchus ocellatus]
MSPDPVVLNKQGHKKETAGEKGRRKNGMTIYKNERRNDLQRLMSLHMMETDGVKLVQLTLQRLQWLKKAQRYSSANWRIKLGRFNLDLAPDHRNSSTHKQMMSMSPDFTYSCRRVVPNQW